jgi:hypothetical protein
MNPQRFGNRHRLVIGVERHPVLAPFIAVTVPKLLASEENSL